MLYTRPVDSHSETRGNILARPPNIFTGPLWGEKFRIFLFKMVHCGVLYVYFWPTAGPPNVSGPEVANPPTHPLDGLVYTWARDKPVLIVALLPSFSKNLRL